MKKILCKVAMVATILLGGFSMTSCGSDDIINAINTAISLYQQINAGQTVKFVGKADIQKWTWNEANNQYEYDQTKGVAVNSADSCTLCVTNSKAAIQLGGFQVGDYNVTYVNIPEIAYSNGTIGEDGYGYAATFTVKYNGETTAYATPNSTSLEYPYAAATGTVGEDGALNLVVTLYMSEKEAFHVVYSGSQVSTK